MLGLIRPTLFIFLLVSTGSCTAKSKAKTPIVLKETLFDAAEAGLRARVFRAQDSAGKALRVFVAQLEASDVDRMKLTAAQRPMPLHDVVQNQGVRVAINGGFYDAKKPMGLVLAAGKTLAPKTPRGGSGIFVIDQKGARILHRDAYSTSLKPRLALQSIDRIVDAGQSLMGPGANPAKDARSAVVVNKAGDVLLVAVFAEAAIDSELNVKGRVAVELSKKSSTTGVSLAEFAQLLLTPQIAAETALNLDGGYSTSFFAHFGERSYEVVAHEATINALGVASP